MSKGMTDYQFRKFLRMIYEIISQCTSIEQAKQKLLELIKSK